MQLNGIEIKILRACETDEEANDWMPKYGTPQSAGLDLRANLKDDQWIFLRPNEVRLIPTGISLNLQNTGVAAFIFPRSSLGHKHGIVLGNLVGVIDSDYQGEIMVSLWNRSDEGYMVRDGNRIAQLVIMPVLQINSFVKVTEFSSVTERGAGGFGSTGKN